MLSQSLPLNDGLVDSVVEELAHSEIVKPAHVSKFHFEFHPPVDLHESWWLWNLVSGLADRLMEIGPGAGLHVV